jgi:hypothetical protein
MLRLRDALGVEVAVNLAQHVVIALFLEIGDYDRFRVVLRIGAGEAELFRGPQADNLLRRAVARQFKSLGNILVNPSVGMLLPVHRKPQRLRVNGEAMVNLKFALASAPPESSRWTHKTSGLEPSVFAV